MFNKIVNNIFNMCILYVVYALGMQGYNYMTGNSTVINIVGSIISAAILSVYLSYCIVGITMDIKLDVVLILSVAFIAVVLSTTLTVVANNIFYSSAILFIMLIIVYIDVVRNMYLSLKAVKQ